MSLFSLPTLPTTAAINLHSAFFLSFWSQHLSLLRSDLQIASQHLLTGELSALYTPLNQLPIVLWPSLPKASDFPSFSSCSWFMFMLVHSLQMFSPLFLFYFVFPKLSLFLPSCMRSWTIPEDSVSPFPNYPPSIHCPIAWPLWKRLVKLLLAAGYSVNHVTLAKTAHWAQGCVCVSKIQCVKQYDKVLFCLKAYIFPSFNIFRSGTSAQIKSVRLGSWGFFQRQSIYLCEIYKAAWFHDSSKWLAAIKTI